MNRCRRSSLFAFLLATAAFAQQPLTERIDVTITNVDVVVTGADGQPIHGLTRDDFLVFEDGKPQPITNLSEFSGELPSTQTAQPAEDGDPAHRRKVLVLIDVSGTSKYARAVALADLERMIDAEFHSGDYDWSAGVLTSRAATAALPFTSDKSAIHDAFEQMRHAGERHERDTPPPVETETQQFSDETARVMAFDEGAHILRAGFVTRALIDAIRAFAATPGKKIILLISGDLGLNDLNPGGTPVPERFAFEQYERQRELAELRASVIREANVADVNLYFLNAEGLHPQETLGVTPREATNLAAAFGIARGTGGRVFSGNDQALSLRQFQIATSNYYSLGYRSLHGEDGKEHRLGVGLKKGIRGTLQFRRSYTPATAEARLERVMTSSVASALLPKQLPVDLATGKPALKRRTAAVPVRVVASKPEGIASMKLYLSVFDEHGNRAFTGTFPMIERDGTMVWENDVVLTRGVKNQIVTAVFDELSDRIGFASRIVQIAE